MGATIAATGVVRTVFDEAGTALASELEITGEDGLVLLAAKPADYAMEVAIAVAALLAVAVVVLLAVWLRSRRKRHMLEAIARDRKRIAGDLHDTIEQHLATAKILLSGALRRKNIPDEIADAIKAAAGVLVNTKVEVRDAVMDLRGESTTFATLADELKAAAKRMTASGTVNVRTSLNALPADLAVSVRRDIVAIVREAMTNAIKHGKAKRIVLVADSLGQLRVRGGFVLRILNDGEKFDAAAALGPEAGHFGLFGMKERALRSGLSLSFVSDDKWCGVKIVRS